MQSDFHHRLPNADRSLRRRRRHSSPAARRTSRCPTAASWFRPDAGVATGIRATSVEISGTIGLDSDIYVKAPYLTVAGQTAPSPGITIKNHGLYIGATDVLLQHFRIRPGSTCARSEQPRPGNTGEICCRRTLHGTETDALGRPSAVRFASVGAFVNQHGERGDLDALDPAALGHE
jgi:hypothetical protein